MQTIYAYPAGLYIYFIDTHYLNNWEEDVVMEYVFMAVGPALLIIGIITLFKRRVYAKESTVVNGVVAEIRTGPANRNRTAYYPVIRYLNPLTSSEEMYESSTAYGSTEYRIGDKVELRYLNTGVKKQLCLNNWSGIWGLSFALILFGIIFCVIDYLIFFLGAKV
jgi:hypothetical protein